MSLSLYYSSTKDYLCAPSLCLTWVCSSSPPSVSLLKLTLDPEGCLLLLFGFRWAWASGAFGGSLDQLLLSCSLVMWIVSARGPESKASLSWGCKRPTKWTVVIQWLNTSHYWLTCCFRIPVEEDFILAASSSFKQRIMAQDFSTGKGPPSIIPCCACESNYD